MDAYERVLSQMSYVWRVLSARHSVKNVFDWCFLSLIGSKLLVCIYRKFMLPRVVRRVSSKSRIKVVFLPMSVAMWRYDAVYQSMAKDDRFEPMIITAPCVLLDESLQIEEQHRMLHFFRERGFMVAPGYDEESKTWISLSDFSPDLIFYTQPYDRVVASTFAYWRHLDSLICYAPYGFQLPIVRWNWDTGMHNYAWKHYLIFSFYLEICRSISRIKGVNAVPVGYFFEEEYCANKTLKIDAESVWKGDCRKRVIWAPHHSIRQGATLKMSSFLEICDAMISLRDKYRKQIIFAFKPHPILKKNLYEIWGKERTDSYYMNWDNAENAFLAESSFVPLFAGSDAMIHCCGSFIYDYLYTGKPVQYVYATDRAAPEFDGLAYKAMDMHYSAHNIADIEHFLHNVVLRGEDEMAKLRRKFFQDYLKSPNGKTFSENVIDDILVGLGRKSST